MKAIKFFAAAAVVAALAVSCNSSNDPKVDVEMPTAAEVDSVSYLIGVNFGSFLKGNNFAENLNEINMAEVKKGMQAFLDAEGTPYDPDFGEQFKINPNDMGRILNGFITKKQAYKAAVNLAKGKEFLAANAKKAKSAPPCLSSGATPGTSVVLPLSPPIQLPGKQHPCCHLWLSHLP